MPYETPSGMTNFVTRPLSPKSVRRTLLVSFPDNALGSGWMHIAAQRLGSTRVQARGLLG